MSRLDGNKHGLLNRPEILAAMMVPGSDNLLAMLAKSGVQGGSEAISAIMPPATPVQAAGIQPKGIIKE